MTEIEIADILNRDVGIVWTGTEMITYGYTANIEGVDYNAIGNLIFDVNQGWPQIVKK